MTPDTEKSFEADIQEWLISEESIGSGQRIWRIY